MLNSYRTIIKDGTVTIMFNQYTFAFDEGAGGYRNHYDHNIEVAQFEDKWTCHDCNKFWDEFADADYRDEVAVLEEEKEEATAGKDELAINYEDEQAEYKAERQAEYDAENQTNGFYGDNMYNGFGDY